MKFDEMLTMPAKMSNPLMSKTPPRYADFIPDNGKRETETFYPDGSRSFDDLVSAIGMSTGEGFPFMAVYAGFLLRRQTGGTPIYFEDGFLTPPHKHNFVELAYVMEGQFHKQIEGKEYVFNRGEFFLLNRDVSHGEYYYRKNSAVIWLRLSNAFFDRSMGYRDPAPADRVSQALVERLALNDRKEYCFIRFIPPPPPSRFITGIRSC